MLVVMLHDCPAVGDRHHDGGGQPGPDQPVEREFIALVERGGGLVEEDHRGFMQQNPRERDALLAALNRGRPGMAAVDVFESEPILQGHALLRLENCICTPHIGYVEQESYELYFGTAFDNVVNFIKGTPTNIVNPGALQVRR